jgi:multisubunit Na+/H+ antiporter MnhC subunit
MLTSIVIGVAVFVAQIALYRVVSSKLALRRSYRNRLASLRTVEHGKRIQPSFGHNRPGEN